MKKEQCSKDHGAVQDAKSSISCSEAAVGTDSAALSVSAEACSSGREAADSNREAGTNTGSVTASDVADPQNNDGMQTDAASSGGKGNARSKSGAKAGSKSGRSRSKNRSAGKKNLKSSKKNKNQKNEEKSSTTFDLLSLIGQASKELNLSQDAVLALAAQPAFPEFFSGVTDFRCASRIQYPLANILLMVLFALLAVHRCSFHGIATYIDVNRAKFIELKLLKDDGKVPSHDVLRWIFMNLDSSNLNAAVIFVKFLEFFNFISEAMKNPDIKRHLVASGDGKVMRGTGRGKETKQHRKALNMMNIYLTGFHLCLLSIPVLKKASGNAEGEAEMDPEDRKKTNEIPVLQDVMKSFRNLFTKGMIFTADALHCQTETINLIVNTLHIDYLLCAKSNQKVLFQAITDTINANMSDITVIRKKDILFQLYRIPAWMDTHGFAGAHYFVRAYSNRHSRRKTSERLYISSLSNPEAVIDAIEARWKIEDDFHRSKDLVFLEDSFTCTNITAADNMCIMINIAYAVLCLFRAVMQSPTQDYAVQDICRDPISALNVVATVLDSESLKDDLKKKIGVISRRR